jgi:hypothetical protein
MRNTLKSTLVLIVFGVSLSACSSIAAYNEKAYENATSAKAEALNIIGKSTEDYNAHKAEIENVKLDVIKAYEFAKGIPKNDAVVKSYEIIINKDGNSPGSLFGVISFWKTKGKFSSYYVSEISTKLGKQFDQIISLEQHKNKP